MNRRLFLRAALLLLSALPVWAAETYTPFRPDLPAGTAYTIDARQLHPTQFAVGFREVAFKTKAINGKAAAALVAYLQEKDVPVVIGPGGVPYMADGHHTIRALLDSQHPDKTVYGHILANWAALDAKAFWAQMLEHHYAFLANKDGTGDLPAAELPVSLFDMQSNIYRGLGWAVMKAGGFDELKGPGGYFQEFYWGDFFRSTVRWNDTDDADFKRAVKEACVLAHGPSAAKLPGYIPAAKAP
jgi:hypothetical protein